MVLNAMEKNGVERLRRAGKGSFSLVWLETGHMEKVRTDI